MALTPAEKQRRYRARRKAGIAPVHYRTVTDRRSNPQRWNDAVQTLLALQDHYQAWYDNLPESLHETPLGEKLQAIADIDLSELADIDPPRGYGRDR